MADSIDAWYQRELEYLRSAGADFASRFGKIADRLSLSATETQDPHVERLLQGVAFLNARIRQKLDDSFPELVDALLGVLYPHLVNPVPSMSVIQFEIDRKQSDLVQGYSVARNTVLDTERINGHAGRFRTCYPVKLFPLEVTQAEIVTPPFKAPRSKTSADAAAAFHLALKPVDPKSPISTFGFDSLRFYVDMSNFERAARLVELLTAQSLELAITGKDPEAVAASLTPATISQVGFDKTEAILPTAVQSFPGYRLLTEYLALPQKFLFFELKGFTPEILSRIGNQLDLWIYLRERDKDLESLVRPATIRLGCTPILNLFTQTADAIPLSRKNSEYRVLPDSRAEGFKEVYSIDYVQVTDDKNEVEYHPFFSVSHSKGTHTAYWHAVRRPGPSARDVGNFDGPSEVYVTLVDDQFRDIGLGQGFLRIRTSCFNRVIPEQLAKHELSKIKLTIEGGGGAVGQVRCLVAPTRTIRRHLGASNLWPLISQLSLNHLSMTGENGKTVLREMLRLNDPVASVHTNRLVEGILDVSAKPCIERLSGIFARGTEVKLLLDDEYFAGNSAYLFCGVIDYFLSMYSSINSFTKLSAITTARKEVGIAPWKWPPKTGNRPLI